MRSFCLSVVFLVPFICFSQTSGLLTDSQFSLLQDKVRSLLNSNVDSAIVLSDRIGFSDNYSHKAFAYAAKSYLCQIKGNAGESERLYKKAFWALDKVVPSKEKNKLHAYVLNFGGLTDWKKNNFNAAIRKYQEGKKLSVQADDLIQVVKFNNNMALIHGEVGNYRLAINSSEESEAVMDANQRLYTPEQFRRGKSNVNLNLGTFYEKRYFQSKDRILLDSSAWYYKKAILYSKDFLDNKLKAQKNLANIYGLKGDFERAEKIYQSLLVVAKEKGNSAEYCNINYNLGDLYFTVKKNKEALVFFKRVDSIHQATQKNQLEFIRSNYYQSKIYHELGDKERALKYSKRYTEDFEKFESELNEQMMKVNYTISNQDLKKEMVDLQSDYSDAILLRRFGTGFIVLLIVALSAYIFKQHRDKKMINEKVNKLIEEFKNKESHVAEVVVDNKVAEQERAFESSPSLTIDEEKENEIVRKLKMLEQKQEFLKPNFTQQAVAKKIKTNTTYLSYVVNKRFGKTFSEYSNELKINYVIDEMIRNPLYRKYSTQAIAESVGFKNAVSFTKSFSKRTGVSPTQFAKRLID